MTAIEEMLSRYSLDNEDQYKQAFKEIMQEVVLCGLARSGFFDVAAFTGGTALRILHGIRRFSEDLDFSLLSPDNDFSFEKYLPYVKRELNANGFDIELGKVKENSAVKSAFIKADTYKLVLNFLSVDPEVFQISKTEKVKVKLEIDTNPPAGAQYEEITKLLPSPYIIKCLERPSMFALKCHALMCRKYIKGRDYYDYLWFMSQGSEINYELLKNAFYQTEGEILSQDDIKDHLRRTFHNADIDEVKDDVRRFLENPDEIEEWTNDIFENTIKNVEFQNCAIEAVKRRRCR